MADVSFERKDFKEVKKRYTIVSDCLGGELQVKSKGTAYLPMPNAHDAGAENTVRYAAYKTRACFYSVTKNTLDNLCGQIYNRDPIIELPEKLKPLIANADGAGVSLIQVSKAGADYTLGYGRAGLFVDHPATEGEATKEEIARGDVRPTITIIDPKKIINWRTITRGARELLSLVVWEEPYTAKDDGFAIEEKTQWRALRLIDGLYVVEIYRPDGKGGKTRWQTFMPTDADGNRLDEIPFIFIGARNNDSKLDDVPMYDIASLNLAHYRNSADYEESAFMVGQPTPVFAGLSEDWVTNVLKGKVQLGSRGSVSLPQGGEAYLLQAAANTMPFEAMKHKEKQMVALGAKLVEDRAVQRTASEATIDYSNQSSVLASIAKNVSAAFQDGLVWAMRFIDTSAATASIKFKLNTDFDIARLSPEDRRQLIEEWVSQAITYPEMREVLRKGGIASATDDAAQKDLKAFAALLPKPEPKAALAGGGKKAKAKVDSTKT